MMLSSGKCRDEMEIVAVRSKQIATTLSLAVVQAVLLSRVIRA